MKGHIFGLLLVLGLAGQVFGQTFSFTSEKFVYKTVDNSELEMTVYIPERKSTVALPAIVFFFGGGWVGGTPDHFKQQAEYFASRGVVTICPDYRVKSRQGTSPFESVKDARSAMRYVRANAEKLGIDAKRIVAAGGSAGGHLAACTAIIDEINEDSDDLTVSAQPMALVLFNPVVDTGARGYGSEKVKGREFEISPVHHITPGLPPALLMHGKKDTTVPYENAVRFKSIMTQEGNACKLKGYCKQKHGFFNYSRSPKHFKKTLRASEKFLDELNLLKGESWVGTFCKQIKAAQI